MHEKRREMAVVLPIAVFSIAASAVTAHSDVMVGDTIELDYLNTNPGRMVDWEFKNHSGRTKAGFFNWEGGIQTFCIQLREDIADSATTYDVVSLADAPENPPAPGPLGDVRAAVMQDLFSRYYNELFTKTGAAAKNWAAAFQIVVWEISHETSADPANETIYTAGLDLEDGKAEFDASNNVMNIANMMLDNLGDGGFLSNIDLVGLTNRHHQDQIMVVESMTVVPGIGSLAILGGVGAIGRRRRR